jgi:glycosyltransferase involved in cell wall biosynthesis
MDRAYDVVIPARDAARFIGEAVESLLAQTIPPRQIVVVDDGSRDGTADAVRRLSPTVTVVRRETGGGSSVARNTGIRHCRSPLVGFLDADDVSLPARFETQMDALAAQPHAAMVFCGIAYARVDGSPTGDVMAVPDFESERFCGALFERNRVATTSAALLRRGVIDALGGFDEQLAYNEEYDLWLRLALTYPVAHVPVPLVLYRLHGGNISRSREGQRLNEQKALLKHPVQVIRDALLRTYSDPGRVELSLAQVLFRRGEIGASRALLLAIDPAIADRAEHAFYLGNTALTLDDVADAARRYEQALGFDASLAPALNNLGVVLARKGDVPGAAARFDAASRLRPGYHDPIENLTHLAAGRPDLLRPTLALLRPVLRPQ